MLLLDVDGVISLFGFDHRRPPAGHYALVDGTMHFLSATAAALIDELARAFELVWCTGWEEKADEHLPAQLGLPRGLAHLTFVAAASAAVSRHWKLDAIDAFAGPRRPLAWVDDAHDDSCHAWAASRPGPTLLVVTDPAVGITDAHVLGLGEWAASLTGGAG
jgi:HAD domain in Swiss Army Knife RNA repair proteins